MRLAKDHVRPEFDKAVDCLLRFERVPLYEIARYDSGAASSACFAVNVYGTAGRGMHLDLDIKYKIFWKKKFVNISNVPDR